MLDETAFRRFRGVPPMQPIDYEITKSRVDCLTKLLSDPATYTQRFTDELSFLPTGGQRWDRSLQIQIPPDTEVSGSQWWIVSLGQYTRARLADFVVTNASGARLNLVTRKQHGDVLADITTSAIVPKKVSDTGSLGKLIDPLRKELFLFFTTLHLSKESYAASVSQQLEVAFNSLLASLYSDPDAPKRSKHQDIFNREIAAWVRATQYLCWVKARPGEVVNLHTSYTLADPKQHRTPHRDERWTALTAAEKRRARRADLYRQLGLAPIDYSFKAPKRPAAPGSYYLILQPPPSTEVTYFDWESDYIFGEEVRDSEVKCAYPAAHVHSTDNQHPAPSGGTAKDNDYITIRAYLRCAPYRHKQLLGAVALNMAVVFVLADGSLPAHLGEPLQGLIIAAPSVVIGFLTQQKRHYYSDVIRRQRGFLWTYLAFSLTFLVSVGFSQGDGTTKLQGIAEYSAWALVAYSGLVFGWQFWLSGFYRPVVKRLTNRRIKKGGKADERWEHFGAAARRFGTYIIASAVICGSLAVGAMALFWNPSSAQDQHALTMQPRGKMQGRHLEGASNTSPHPHQHIQPQLVITRKAEGR